MARPPQAQHKKNNRDELQAHTPAHELLRLVGRAAAHHVEEAKTQHDENGDHEGGAHVVKQIHWSDTLFIMRPFIKKD